MKDVTEIVILILGGLALIALVIALSLFALLLLWGWIVPDVFSGAVAQGVVPGSITFIQALKLSILIWILSGFRLSSSKK